MLADVGTDPAPVAAAIVGSIPAVFVRTLVFALNTSEKLLLNEGWHVSTRRRWVDRRVGSK
jgi:hypothetical protein